MTQLTRRTKLKIKLAKLRNGVNRKAFIIKEIMSNAFQPCESTCHECYSKYEVENYIEDIVV